MEQIGCDVLVVGGGLAGHAAALSAAEDGADVLLIEKQPEVGGSSVLAGGSFAFAGTDMQKERGIEDSESLLSQDLLEVGQGKNDPQLVGQYAHSQLGAYYWLREHGVEFMSVQAASGQSVPRSHLANPRMVVDLLHKTAQSLANIHIVTGCAAERLVQDPDTKRVTGLMARQGTTEYLLRAERGVVLTSGGFGQNKEMIAAFAPGKEKALLLGALGNVGDGLKMAWKLGAGLRDMPYVKGTFGNYPETKVGQHLGLEAVYKGAIAVNKAGRRFVDESLDYKLLGDACLLQEDALTFQILDQKVMDASVPGYTIFDFRRRLDQGLMVAAPTLGELSEKIGVPAGQLEETVQIYNAMVRSGSEDSFGRRHLTHRFGDLVEIDAPPFYAYPSTTGIVATYAGITVSPKAEVIDVFGEAIPHLFAAGEIMGGFHGAAYMTGTSLGKATIFGRIAGKEAARKAS